MVVDYSLGKVYKIKSKKTKNVYIGSTCQELCIRFKQHKTDYNRFVNKIIKKISITSGKIFEYGVDDAYIELIENYPCKSRAELLKREGEIIKSMKKCVNSANPHNACLYKKNKEIKDIKKENQDLIELYKENIGNLELKNKLRDKITNRRVLNYILYPYKKRTREEIIKDEEREKERKKEWEKEREIQKEKDKLNPKPIIPFNTSKDGNPMVVRENREAYYEYRNNISNTFATLFYKEYKIKEAEKEEKKEVEKEADKESEKESKTKPEKELVKIKKKTKKQREREIEKEKEKKKEIFKKFCNTKVFKYNMLYIDGLEYIKKANGCEWLEKIYEKKCNLEMYKVEYDKIDAVQYNNLTLIEELLISECTENIFIFLEKNYNIECDTIEFYI